MTTVVAAPPVTPTNVLVYASDFRLSPSRDSAPSGRLRLQLKNNGQDAHNIAVRRRAAGAPPLAESPVMRPRGLTELTVTLPPGRYVLFCAVADHAARGMQRGFTVLPRRRPSRVA